METVPFHFLLLAAGEVLKYDIVVTAQKIQDFIQDDYAFGVRVPLKHCRLALELLADSYLLKELGSGDYIRYEDKGYNICTTLTSTTNSLTI